MELILNASSVLSNCVDGLQSLQLFVFSQHKAFPDLHSTYVSEDLMQVKFCTSLYMLPAVYVDTIEPS